MSSAPKRYKRDSKSISSGNFMLSNTKLYDNDVVIIYMNIYLPINDYYFYKIS